MPVTDILTIVAIVIGVPGAAASTIVVIEWLSKRQKRKPS